MDYCSLESGNFYTWFIYLWDLINLVYFVYNSKPFFDLFHFIQKKRALFCTFYEIRKEVCLIITQNPESILIVLLIVLLHPCYLMYPCTMEYNWGCSWSSVLVLLNTDLCWDPSTRYHTVFHFKQSPKTGPRRWSWWSAYLTYCSGSWRKHHSPVANGLLDIWSIRHN